MVIASPPPISQAYTMAPVTSARGPARRICAIRVSMPNAVIAMVSAKVSSVFSVWVAVSGKTCNEFTITSARKPSANQGMASLRFVPLLSV